MKLQRKRAQRETNPITEAELRTKCYVTCYTICPDSFAYKTLQFTAVVGGASNKEDSR